MVSIRCKLMVKDELDTLGISYSAIELGDVEINESLTPPLRDQFSAALKKIGLELMDDKKSILVEKIKTIIIETLHHSDEAIKINYSKYLSEELLYDYTYLANLFSETTGITIEYFIINHRIERVKELLIYDELSLTEISYKLNYSSVAHLSSQFKKVTGLTPTFFKLIKRKRNNVLENV